MANPSIVVEFVAQTAKLVSGVKDVQKAGDQASKGFDWKRAAKWVGAIGAVAGATKLIKDSVSATEDLAKATMAIERATGLDTKTSSEWAAVLKSRNIDVGTFQTSITKLSKEMVGATSGSKKSVAAFNALGVSMADVRSGDTQKVIMEVSDGLSKIQNPAQRAALASQLFGKTYTKLAPLLFKGSGAIQEQLDLVNKYGDTIDGKTGKSVADLIAQQRELGIATQGVKVKLGTALIPVLLTLVGVIVTVTRVLQPFLTSATTVKVALAALAVTMIVYKGTMLVVTAAEALFNVQLGITQVLITGGVIVAILALIAVGYELYKHWDDLQKIAGEVWGAVKDGAEAALGWLKANWPLVLGILTGPFGLAAGEVIKHWSEIKAAISGAVATIKSTLGNAVGTVSAAAKSLGLAIVNGILGALGGIGNAVWSVVNNIWDALLNQSETVRAWGAKVGAWLKAALVSGLVGIGNDAWSVINNIWAALQNSYKTIVGWGESVGKWIKSGVLAGFAGVADAITNTIKGAINAVLRAWNAVKVPGIHVKVLGKSVGIGGFGLPPIPLLAQGGLVTQPTLAMLGERGPEAVLPLGANGAPVEVRVFIGETELRGLVRTEVVSVNNRTAQVLLAGAR